MISSGVTAKATVDNDAVILLVATPGYQFRHFMIVNEGANPGFWQIGTGPLVRISAGSFKFYDEGDIQIKNQVVNIVRPAGGPNMTGVFGLAF